MKLLQAIQIARAGKYRVLDIKYYSNNAEWNSLEDTDWQEYKKAWGIIVQYVLIEKILKMLKII